MALDLKKEYAVDKNKEIEGVWQDFGSGAKMKIARIGNSEYQKVFQKISKPHRKSIRRGTLADDVAEKLLVEAMAESILLDWEGVEDGGVALPYTKENAIRVLLEYKDLRDQVTEIANEMESFKAEEDAEAEKN